MPSRRRLPGRSGMTRRCSSSTCTKPGGSPLGETSARPLAPEVAIRTNGERAMNARQCASRWEISLRTASSLGFPTRARSASSDVTASRNGSSSMGSFLG